MVELSGMEIGAAPDSTDSSGAGLLVFCAVSVNCAESLSGDRGWEKCLVHSHHGLGEHVLAAAYNCCVSYWYHSHYMLRLQ